MSKKQSELLSSKVILKMVGDARRAQATADTRVRTRRQLIIRDADAVMDNLTGTYIPEPFKDSVLIIKTVIGETAKAAQHYASRVAANNPKVSISPPSAQSELSKALETHAGDQEKLDTYLWDTNGGREAQWDSGMNMTVGGVSYYVTEVADASFGLPDREYYDDDNEELAILKREGKITPAKVWHPSMGKWTWAEHGDAWAKRRLAKGVQQAQDGGSLFTLEALPRDMVVVGRDRDRRRGLKWAAIVEEIPGTDCLPDSDFTSDIARKNGTPEDDVGLYGIWLDSRGKVYGGIPQGGPAGYGYKTPENFTMIRFKSRIEDVVLIAPAGGGFEGAVEVYRGKHGANVHGEPRCPVVEVPMMRTGIMVPGQEFTTPMEPVFAYVPIIDQLLTGVSSADGGFNLYPRWVVENADGTIIRGEDGEPKAIDNAPAPGMDPSEAAAYPGTLRQLLIDTQGARELLAQYWERLDACMPSASAMGDSGSSAAAWQVRLNIQQFQESLRQPVDNHASGVKQIFQLWHGWMRKLDQPVYFFARSTFKTGERAPRALIKFNPADLTDAIDVTQELDTPEEQTVRIQQGLELRAQGAITWRQFFDEYLKAPDAREAEIDMYVQQVTDHVMGGVPAPPGSVIQIVADGLRGQIHYAMLDASPAYAVAQAEQMATQAQMQEQAGAQVGMPDGGMGVTQAAGIVEPGMGMASSLEEQLGTGVPGGMAPAMPVVA